MKFCMRLHDIKLQKRIENPPVILESSVYNMQGEE